MVDDTYSIPDVNTSDFFINRNIVTVARALGGKRLNKTIFGDGRPDIQYDNAFHYKFFSINIECLDELCQLVRVLLHRPQSCLIRGVAKDDTVFKQRRLLYDDKKTGDPATIIEQEQNWYALDVDNYGNSSGNLKQDAKSVLLALGLENVQAFAIPSANYLRKQGIRIRLFMWNSMKVSSLTLKKYFTKVVDPALFSPIQPIYVARPTFINMNDPCKDLLAWIPGDQIFSEIPEMIHSNVTDERKYTRKQAEAFRRKKILELWEITEGHRHPALFGVALFLGKLIWQDLLDEDEVVEELLDKCLYYWRGDAKRDQQTILDGIKRGKAEMEEANEF